MTDELDWVKRLEPQRDPPSDETVAAQRLALQLFIADRETTPQKGLRSIARRRWARPRLLAFPAFAALIAVAVIVAGAMILWTTGSGQSHRTRVTTGSARINRDDVVRMLTPTSPRDYAAATAALLTFESRVSHAAIEACYSQAGYAGAQPVDDVAPTLVRYFEDPALIREKGLAAVGVLPGTNSVTSAVPPSVVEKCRPVGEAAVASVHDLTDPLLSAWVTEIQQLEISPGVMAAWNTWQVCMATAGYQVKNDDDFYALAGQEAAGTEAAPADQLARDYASCLDRAGIVQARTAARVPARTQFITQNARAIDDAQNKLPDAIEDLSSRYGVSFSGQ